MRGVYSLSRRERVGVRGICSLSPRERAGVRGTPQGKNQKTEQDTLHRVLVTGFTGRRGSARLSGGILSNISGVEAAQ